MPESDHTWQKTYKAEPIEARHVRLWVAGRVKHTDAPHIAHELYVAVLGSGAPVIEMGIWTAGNRIRITAEGYDPLPLINSHGPGWQIICGLADLTGLTTDERGVWAQLGTKR
jgi:hypothetical protein